MTKKTDQTEERIVKVEEALTRTEKFIEKNQKILIYVIGGIVAVVLLYMAYKKFYLAPREARAQSQMFMAEKYFEKDSLKKAVEGDGSYPGFKAIIDDYSGTKSANLSRYYLGICYLKMGQYDNAIEQLKKFSSDDDILGPMAKGAIGDAYTELKNYDKAAENYIDASELKNNVFTSPMYLMRAGLLYEEMKKYDKALEMYNKIKKEYFQSTEARDINKYIAHAEGMLK
jgi:tetratricopeptide (TPR) repeat protein